VKVETIEDLAALLDLCHAKRVAGFELGELKFTLAIGDIVPVPLAATKKKEPDVRGPDDPSGVIDELTQEELTVSELKFYREMGVKS
jgi:hypothetical protein